MEDFLEMLMELFEMSMEIKKCVSKKILEWYFSLWVRATLKKTCRFE
jgi:hypothetical protein